MEKSLVIYIMNNRTVNNLIVAGGLVGISALVAGCQKQVIRVNINEPNAYIVSVDDSEEQTFTKKELEIPPGRDFILIIEHEGGEDKLELDGDLCYHFVRDEEEGVSLYAVEEPTPQRNPLQNPFLSRASRPYNPTLNSALRNRLHCPPNRPPTQHCPPPRPPSSYRHR